jgi:hypothetical protein
MKSNHTKGEWIAKDGQIYPQETGKTLALIPYFELGNEEQEANQKLIAAAPTMLEALILVRAQMTAHIPESTFDLIDKAINKAKGVNQ